MENKVADVSNVSFDLEQLLDLQFAYGDLPFNGMDKSRSPVCLNFCRGNCMRGNVCPYRHMKSKRAVVCKHWLRGLCKKGDDCEFRHQFDMSRMPECYFYAVHGECTNKDCVFLHVKSSKAGRCPLFDRGFCRLGPLCCYKHIRRVLCQNYIVGFCPLGKDCEYEHASFDEPKILENTRLLAINCHNCGQLGHKALNCPRSKLNMMENFFEQEQNKNINFVANNRQQQKPLNDHQLVQKSSNVEIAEQQVIDAILLANALQILYGATNNINIINDQQHMVLQTNDKIKEKQLSDD